MKPPVVCICFVLGLCCVIHLAGCSSSDPLRGAIGSYRNYKNVKGQFVNGCYISPATNFSCVVPRLLEPGAVVRDAFSVAPDGGRMGSVGFEDDLGTYYRVDWFEITPDLAAQVSDRELFERLFNHQIHTYKQFVPNLSLEKKSFAGEGVDQELFFSADLPGGATISNNGKRLDCSRGTLVLRKGNWGYSITTQDLTVLEPRKPTAEEREVVLRSKLESFVAGFEFK